MPIYRTAAGPEAVRQFLVPSVGYEPIAAVGESHRALKPLTNNGQSGQQKFRRLNDCSSFNCGRRTVPSIGGDFVENKIPLSTSFLDDPGKVIRHLLGVMRRGEHRCQASLGINQVNAGRMIHGVILFVFVIVPLIEHAKSLQ